MCHRSLITLSSEALVLEVNQTILDTLLERPVLQSKNTVGLGCVVVDYVLLSLCGTKLALGHVRDRSGLDRIGNVNYRLVSDSAAHRTKKLRLTDLLPVIRTWTWKIFSEECSKRVKISAYRR